MTQQNIVNEMIGFAYYFLECKKKEGLKQPFIKEPEWGETPRFEKTTESHWLTPHEREVKKNTMFQTTEALHYVSMYINHMYHPLKKKLTYTPED